MISKLVEYLKQCDDAYYNTDQVLIDNDTYDAMVDSLRKMDSNHPYLNKVGASVRTDSNKLGRVVPMGTLSKYHQDVHVEEWIKSEDSPIMIAPKYDGFGVELVYKDCHLIMASTRGTGYVGENVLEAVKSIPNVPHELPEEFSSLEMVRGEAIIPTRNHDIIKNQGYNAMRNAVPGIIRSNRIESIPYVEFVAYEFFDGTDDRVVQRNTYCDYFNTEEFIVGGIDELYAYREDLGIMKNTNSYRYEIDGTVLKTVKIKEDELMCPNHQIAWKWESKYKSTILEGFDFNVGVTGNISVVGRFTPVEFQGAQLKRASLGSLQRYESLKPAVGDMVTVSRRGDIIPYIEDVELHTGEYVEINKCPCCGTPLESYRCRNPHCHDKVNLRISQYIRTVGVKGIGGALVSALVERDLIKKVSDIYLLDADIISELPRQGQSSVNKWKELQSKELNTLQFFNAYPFDNVGKNTWKLILERYSVEEILELTEEDFYNNPIKGIGKSKYSVIVQQIKEDREDIESILKTLNLI